MSSNISRVTWSGPPAPLLRRARARTQDIAHGDADALGRAELRRQAAQDRLHPPLAPQPSTLSFKYLPVSTCLASTSYR
eukprot:534745-Pyramimonas_sp.AAC.1